jgi:uncharacterized protein involved in exopolysaccharide biosynthesis
MTALDLLSALQKRFWLIVAGALIAGAIAAAFSFLWPPTYKAETLLLITKLRPEVTLDPRFQTAAEENVVNLSVQDEQVRRQTLVGLTQSPDLLVRVLDRLGDALPQDERTIQYLQNVTGVRTEGNLISFEVEARSPETAAEVANLWAEVYQDYVNRVYSATSPTYEQIQEQLASAQATYAAAKTEVEDFMRQSPEAELGRQIEQKSRILGDLQAGQLASARQQVGDLLARINGIDQSLLDVQNLEALWGRLPPSTPLTPGEQLSLFSLESKALIPGSVLSSTLELDGNWLGTQNLTAGQAVEKLHLLKDTLTTSRAAVEAQIASRSTTLLGGQELLTYGLDDSAMRSIESLQAEINALQAELTKQQLRKQDLIDARSLARDSYQTLARKAAEVEILSNLVGVEVQIAASAQAPETPAFPRPLITTALGTMAGALAGAALALLLELWPPVSQTGSQ